MLLHLVSPLHLHIRLLIELIRRSVVVGLGVLLEAFGSQVDNVILRIGSVSVEAFQSSLGPFIGCPSRLLIPGCAILVITGATADDGLINPARIQASLEEPRQAIHRLPNCNGPRLRRLPRLYLSPMHNIQIPRRTSLGLGPAVDPEDPLRRVPLRGTILILDEVVNVQRDRGLLEIIWTLEPSSKPLAGNERGLRLHLGIKAQLVSANTRPLRQLKIAPILLLLILDDFI